MDTFSNSLSKQKTSFANYYRRERVDEMFSPDHYDRASSDEEERAPFKGYISSEVIDENAKKCRQLRILRYIVAASTILATVAWVLLGVQYFKHDSLIYHGSVGLDAGQSTQQPVLREAPDFGVKLITFDEDLNFMGDTKEVDANWQKLWPSQ